MRSTRCCICAPTLWGATAAAAPTVTWSSRTWTHTWASWRMPEEASWIVPTHTAQRHHQDRSRYCSRTVCRRTVYRRTVCVCRRTACSISPLKMTWSRARISCRGTLLSSVTSWHPERKLSGSHFVKPKPQTERGQVCSATFSQTGKQKTNKNLHFNKSLGLKMLRKGLQGESISASFQVKSTFYSIFSVKCHFSKTHALIFVWLYYFFLQDTGTDVQEITRTTLGKVKLSHPAGFFCRFEKQFLLFSRWKWHMFVFFIVYLCVQSVSGCCKVLPFCCCRCTQRMMGWVMGVSPDSQSTSSCLD